VGNNGREMVVLMPFRREKRRPCVVQPYFLFWLFQGYFIFFDIFTVDLHFVTSFGIHVIDWTVSFCMCSILYMLCTTR
jgi:hypothetical protein